MSAFLYESVFEAFLYFKFVFVIFWCKKTGKKAALKILVKFTPAQQLISLLPFDTNILCLLFVSEEYPRQDKHGKKFSYHLKVFDTRCDALVSTLNNFTKFLTQTLTLALNENIKLHS